MNRKQFTLLLVLVAALGGLAFLIQKKKSNSWTSGEKPLTGTLLKDFPLNDVTELVIRNKDATVTLTKQGERWTVGERRGYPASFAEIGSFLRKVWDLKPVQRPTVGASQLGRLELELPGKGEKTGTLVEFKGKDGKAIGSLLLGKKHMREGNAQFGGGSFPDGRYVMIPGQLESVALVSESFNDIEPRPADWLAKDFFKVEKLKSVSVTPTNAVSAWSLARESEGGEWQLAGLKADEKLESSATGSFNYLLSSPSFTDLAADTSGLTNVVKAVLETFEGFQYGLTLAPKVGTEDYLLQLAVSANLPQARTPGKDEKPEDKERLDKEFKDQQTKLEEKLKQEKLLEGHTFVINKFAVDQLLKSRQDFLAAKEPPKAEAASPAVDVIPKKAP